MKEKSGESTNRMEWESREEVMRELGRESITYKRREKLVRESWERKCNK